MSLSAQFRRVGNLQRRDRRGRASRQNELIEQDREDGEAGEQHQPLSERLASLCVDARFDTVAIDAALAGDRRAAAAANNHDGDDSGSSSESVEAGGGAEAGTRTQRPQRWWRVWTEAAGRVDGVPYVQCVLPPEGASAKQPHSSRIASNNSSNVQRHFKDSTHHKAAYERLTQTVDAGKEEASAAKEILDAAVEAFKKRKERTPFKQGIGSKAKKLEQEVMLLSFFVDQGVAFNAVENEFFDHYHKIYGWSIPPNRRRLADVLLPYAYEQAQEWLVEELKDAHYFSIITDAWTSATLDKFVALNICFVSDAWQLKTITLAVIPLNESDTWQTMTTAIAQRVNAALPADAVLVTTVTDNGANFIKLARSLHSNLPIADIEGLYELNSWDEPVDVDEETNASWRCVAHKTQLAVNDVIEKDAAGGARSLIERVRVFTRFMRASTARRVSLKQAQRDLEMPIKVPTLDVATRWSAVYYMLERFCLNYDAYLLMARRGLFDDEPEIEFVSPAELVTVKSLVDALAPIEKFIRLAEGEKYVTLAVVPVYLKRCLESLAPQPLAAGVPPLSSECVQFRRLLRRSLKLRLDYILERPNLALAAAALHPLHGHLQFVEERVRDAMWRELEEWIVGDANGDNAFPPPFQPARSTTMRAGPTLAPATPSREAVRASLLRLRRGFESHFQQQEQQRRRAEQPGGDDDDNEGGGGQDIDPLQWWADYGSQLPDIQHIAKIVCCVPATSAASERVFSSSGVSATSLRARLDIDKVEMMTVLRSVLHAMGGSKWRDWLRKILTDVDAENEQQQTSRKQRRLSAQPQPQP